MMIHIDLSKSLYKTVHTYPETKDYLIMQGMTQVEDEELLQTLGKNITMDVLIQSKKINKAVFVEQIEAIINENLKQADTTLIESDKNKNADISIQGILPCPVRIPLLEGFEEWLNTREPSYKSRVDYELKAASMGVDWLKEYLEQGSDEEEIADVFLSAGFDLFFDRRYMGKYKEEKVFEDIISYEDMNEDFNCDTIHLKDPDGDYSVIGVVPAVFLVNQEALKGKKIPFTWEELINGDYDNSVSLPVGDFDLFNAILLNIYKCYGIDGVERLGKTLMKAMHPSEMIKSDRNKQQQPAVTIMPYFFTKMVRGNGPMQAVWPKDGAIISPIFMLSKRSKKEKLQPIVDFFGSKEVGEILSHNGRFPSTHPEVDNLINKENKYMWIGWDYIKKNDIGQIIETCMSAFGGGIR